MNKKLAGLIAVAASVLFSACAHAQPAPGQGVYDPAFADSEVYTGTPQAAAVPPGPACAAARAYVDHVYNGRFDQMIDLFAEDAIIYWPMRAPNGDITVERLQGRERIDSFYRNVIGRTRPYAVPVTMLGNETDCMMQVAARTEIAGAQRYRLSAINHFTVNASGKVIRLISFQRSGLPRQ